MTNDASRLEALGYDAFFAEAFAAVANTGLVPARVVGDGRTSFLLAGCATRSGELTGALLARPDERPVVGDWVAVSDRAEPALVHEVLPRRTLLRRRAVGREPRAQNVVANVDVFFIVTSANRDLNPRRIERYLTAVWDSGAEPVLVLNKCDLAVDVAPFVARMAEVALGAPIVPVSARDGTGLEQLGAMLQPGRTVAFIGSSGVGKSSLINHFTGRSDLDARAIRPDGKGRHTTTRRELLAVSGGALLIDTPGMRELGLVGDEGGLDAAFAEIVTLAEGCRFRDCEHGDEPGCAVHAAVTDGMLSPVRLASYQKLVRETRASDARRDPVQAANAKRRWKAIHKRKRALGKQGGKRD
jgi:ribosome biogenesis GTPase